MESDVNEDGLFADGDPSGTVFTCIQRIYWLRVCLYTAFGTARASSFVHVISSPRFSSLWLANATPACGEDRVAREVSLHHM